MTSAIFQGTTDYVQYSLFMGFKGVLHQKRWALMKPMGFVVGCSNETSQPGQEVLAGTESTQEQAVAAQLGDQQDQADLDIIAMAC